MSLSKGGRPRKKTGSQTDPVSEHVVTLAEMGIGKHLADTARKLAAMSEATFEKRIADARAAVEQGARITERLFLEKKQHRREQAPGRCPTCGSVVLEVRR